MKAFGRILLAVAAGMALAFVLVVLVELFSSVVHPFPADFNGNIPEHGKRYPHWVLAAAALFWGVASAAATWVASRIGGLPAAIVVTLLLGWALTFNLTALPYTLRFKITMFTVFPIACYLGFRYGRRAPSSRMLRQEPRGESLPF
jgi:hypothetical protein